MTSDGSLTGKRVLVMGLGRFGGGVDVAMFAAQAGARVVVTDLATEEQLSDSVEQLRQWPDIEFHLGRHEPDDFSTADMIVANPAVKPDNRFLDIARRHGRQITSQMGLFFQRCPAPIVGITGANGKSTTTALIAHLLENAGDDRPFGKVWLSGNIGDQPLLTILDKIAPDDRVVLEISSFQVEQLAELHLAPHVALLTNLTPNHLDRYGAFEAYCAAKEGLFQHQKPSGDAPAISIFNAEDAVGRAWLEKYRGQAGRVCMTFSADDVDAEVRSVYGLPGRAYLSNLAAALAVVRSLGVRVDSVKAALPGFKALPHRLERVAEFDGVRWYNDSKATTPLSSMVALEAFDGPQILIAGGYDKQLPFDALGETIVERAKAVVLIGQTAQKIADAVRKAAGKQPVRIEFAESLSQAVDMAAHLAVPGDVVLLSPACASYDMFKNFQQRGAQFTELAQRLGR